MMTFYFVSWRCKTTVRAYFLFMCPLFLFSPYLCISVCMCLCACVCMYQWDHLLVTVSFVLAVKRCSKILGKIQQQRFRMCLRPSPLDVKTLRLSKTDAFRSCHFIWRGRGMGTLSDDIRRLLEGRQTTSNVHLLKIMFKANFTFYIDIFICVILC